MIAVVKITTPLGEYPFVLRRIERRRAGLALLGTVAGLESSAVLERSDLRAVGLVLAPLAAALLLASRRSRRGN